ncbi:poly-gamma-glutamate synthesis protein (capsule biosynthesis protein) [Actinocorallia herbida]|uniref:Poly-gamma-glutamate synthesis protein (Capsule biosynthesis protein) n=1 Tax=Actinocorallia herbida TaxID=58109 RepID=A0A3N1DBS1_9ACTN|nr:CapA family protein [Actinocorallia herbida]ROO90972.1 poly-gamma-glutamate synthesis protein (capsule biosynthesis protein) [Actinocorallia herbida]
MRAKLMSAAVVALALSAAACSSAEDKSEAEGGTRPTAEAEGAASNEPEEPVQEAITLAFGGDVHFEDYLRARLATPKTALGPVAATLRKADFAMVNLETAITEGGTPAPGKEFTFRAPATAFKALRAAGVDAVSMANNHGMDFMETGLADSLKAIKKSKFPTLGIGKDADEAYAPYRTEIKGNKIAVLGATQVLDDHLIAAWTATDEKGGLASAKDVDRMVQAVETARKGSDLVVVYLHWGQELATCPLPRQEELADQLVKAGADVVVGGHAHVPLAGGYLRGSYVHYGLGNFVFSSAGGATAASGVLVLKAKGGKILKAAWKPARISSGLPIPLKGAAAKAEVARWKALRDCTGLAAGPGAA